MRFYFLVEGKETESELYPAWLGYLRPELERIQNPKRVSEHPSCYTLYSGDGYPSILKRLVNSVGDLNDCPYYDYFVVVIDSEDESVEQRVQEVKKYMSDLKLSLPVSTELKIIVQHRCIETWLLGNVKMVTRNPQSDDLIAYLKHYDISSNDPELMPLLKERFKNHAKFHLKYLKAIIREKNPKQEYNKNNLGITKDSTYLQALQNRVQTTGHLPSLKGLFDLLGV